ncbi:MAG: hypothetical protein IPN17_02825 [Deltaproteobacteria bacterium]|nr:hypothetical protein [Deltaproteobacteria bacterium]
MSDDTTRITPNPGYVSGLLSRALTTARSHEDVGTRARAEEKLRRFSAVLDGMLDGSLAIGSRTPVPAPAWATLEVVTGGFATGALLAGGPLLEHERSLLRSLGLPEGADARARLNAWHLGEDGLAALRDRLRDGRYRVDVPEEGALLVAAWLLSHDRRAEAHDLLDQIAPFFDRLRFYPAPQERALSGSAVVRLQPLSATVASLEAVKPSPQVARMNEALAVWSPYEDRLVALLRETFEGDAPCRRFPDGWAAKASAALDEYPRLRAAHPLCRRPDKPGETLAILRRTVSRCVADPSSLAERELRALGELLSSIARKRGAPGSTEHSALRATQSAVAALPTHDAFARVLVDRLAPFPLDGGIASLDAVDGPLSSAEAGRAGAFEGALPPVRFIAKLARSLEAPIEELVERGVIPSSEVLAAVAPQITSQVRAAGIDDPSLRLLYGAVYAAFRRRRSLLLLDLAHQVRLEELPWVRAIEGLRRAGSDATAASRVTLEQLSMLAITSYPEVILPNKLLQELSALAKGAGLDLPLVEELAADIFMGTFSPKFVRAAKRAASMLRGTLYERYYDVPTERVLSLKEVVTPKHGRPGATAPSPGLRRALHRARGHPARRRLVGRPQRHHRRAGADPDDAQPRGALRGLRPLRAPWRPSARARPPLLHPHLPPAVAAGDGVALAAPAGEEPRLRVAPDGVLPLGGSARLGGGLPPLGGGAPRRAGRRAARSPHPGAARAAGRRGGAGADARDAALPGMERGPTLAAPRALVSGERGREERELERGKGGED